MSSISEQTFILFNNRSRNLVLNFLKVPNPKALIDLEQKIAWISSQHTEGKTLEIDASKLISNAPDIIYGPNDVESHKDCIVNANKKLLEGGQELDWLMARGITEPIIKKYCLGSLYSIPDDCLDVIGASCHPMLTDLLNPDRGPGITIPLFSEEKLINITIRRIDDLGKLKYTQSVPDINVWGLETIIPNSLVHICEGLFDMMALHSKGLSAVSVSSAMWSGPQLLKLISKMRAANSTPVIVADNDQAGLRCAKVIQRVLNMEGFRSQTCVCINEFKDPAEMIFENNKFGFNHINITKNMVECAVDTSFNFTNYLKDRKF